MIMKTIDDASKFNEPLKMDKLGEAVKIMIDGKTPRVNDRMTEPIKYIKPEAKQTMVSKYV